MLDISTYLSKLELLSLSHRYSSSVIFRHQIRVCYFAASICDTLPLNNTLTKSEKSMLHYCSAIHDIGYFVAKKGHHKHGKYIVQNDSFFDKLPTDCRFIMSVIISSHGKKLDEDIYSLPPEIKEAVYKIIAIIRLADALDHKHIYNPRLKHISLDNYDLNIGIDSENSSAIAKKTAARSQLLRDLLKINVVIKNNLFLTF